MIIETLDTLKIIKIIFAHVAKVDFHLTLFLIQLSFYSLLASKGNEVDQ